MYLPLSCLQWRTGNRQGEYPLIEPVYISAMQAIRNRWSSRTRTLTLPYGHWSRQSTTITWLKWGALRRETAFPVRQIYTSHSQPTIQTSPRHIRPISFHSYFSFFISWRFSRTLQLHCNDRLLSWNAVCLPVCRLSVTWVYCDKTTEVRITHFHSKVA